MYLSLIQVIHIWLFCSREYFHGTLGHANVFLSQRTWTFWHELRWSTRRCPAGAAAPRPYGASRSCRLRLRATSASSRTSCKFQVGFKGADLSPAVRAFAKAAPRLLSFLIAVKWVGVGKSRESMIKLFWSTCGVPELNVLHQQSWLDRMFLLQIYLHSSESSTPPDTAAEEMFQ